MAVALESNVAGDFHLIESGFIATDDFSDPLLGNWTIGTGPATHAVSPDKGSHVQLLGPGKYLRYTGPVTSPTITLPSDRMQVAFLESWNEFNQFLHLCPTPTIGAAIAIGSDSANMGAVGAHGHSTFNKLFFGSKVAYGEIVNGVLNDRHTGLLAGGGPKWLGLSVDPAGFACGQPGESCPPGSNFQTTLAHSNFWLAEQPAAGGFCATGTFGEVGWPAFGSFDQGCPTNNANAYFYEFWGWKHSWIEVRGVPFDHFVRVTSDAGVATSHPTYVTKGEIKNTGFSDPAKAEWVADSCGFTNDRICVYAATASIPFHRVEIINRLGVVTHSITPTTFQPGVFGGDIYTLCAVDSGPLPPVVIPCPIGDCDEGIPVVIPDCDEGIAVVAGNCDEGIAVNNGVCDEGLDICPPPGSDQLGIGLLDRAQAILAARAAVEKPVIGSSLLVEAISSVVGGVTSPLKLEMSGIAISSVVVVGSGPPTGLMLLEGGDFVLLETGLDNIVLEGLFT